MTDEDAIERRMPEDAAPAGDAVEESSQGSFPASDPPSWWAGPSDRRATPADPSSG